jgi:hypothetical protein
MQSVRTTGPARFRVRGQPFRSEHTVVRAENTHRNPHNQVRGSLVISR